ncbi:MAG: rod shape-determining protein MreC [Cytophagaceae bacterium]|nr:rod shape-determining protein MreC [Cytophagaceae bacterium]
MDQLFAFIVRQRAFIFFVALEVLSLWCFFKYNNYPSAVYFNTANYYAGRLLEWQTSATQYINLRTVNSGLAEENARLHSQLAQVQNQQLSGINYKADSAVASRFQTLVAKVINNTVDQRNNFLTIDKGTADGVQPGMGVISATGVVGKVKTCSEHFSVLTSVLHSENMVSSKIRRNGEIASARWEGINPDEISLLYLSRYKSVELRDTVVTSDLNSVFPGGVPVGYVYRLKPSADGAFWDIKLRLATDFPNLAYVYVVNNRLKTEQERLEAEANPK